MKRIPLVMLTISVSALYLAGCSVKEYRESCPCRLVLDLSEVDTAVVKSADLYVSVPGGYISSDVIDIEEFEKEYVLTVPRTHLSLSVSSGGGGAMSEKGLSIPFGTECPPVYMHSSVVDADCEIWHEKVRMRKNHCVIEMQVKNEESYGISLTVKGNICGYDAYGLPESGGFECSKTIEDPGICCIAVPRQTDDSMILEVDDGGGVRKMFALGTYIASAGYDWEASDLEDIEVVLDFAFSHVVVKVQGWEEEHIFDVVI